MSQSSQHALAILCLDGGGYRGLASLLMLQRFMNDHCPKVDGKPMYRPYEVFDFICGTSTGGIIALLLGRLHYSVEEAIQVYLKLGREIFKDPQGLFHWIWSGEGQIDMKVYEKCIGDIVNNQPLLDPAQGRTDRIRPNGDRHRCYAAVTTVQKEHIHAEPIWLRTYTIPNGEDRNADHTYPQTGDHVWSLKEAVRATSAAPTYFDPLYLGGRVFEDAGAAGFNNPSSMALMEINRIPELSGRPISAIVSVGTGLPRDLLLFKEQLLELSRVEEPEKPGFFGKFVEMPGWKVRVTALAAHLSNIASNTEQEHARMYHRFLIPDPEHQCYWRLNVKDIGSIGLAEINKENVLRSKTAEWLNSKMTKESFANLARHIDWSRK